LSTKSGDEDTSLLLLIKEARQSSGFLKIDTWKSSLTPKISGRCAVDMGIAKACWATLLRKTCPERGTELKTK